MPGAPGGGAFAGGAVGAGGTADFNWFRMRIASSNEAASADPLQKMHSSNAIVARCGGLRTGFICVPTLLLR